MPDRSLISCLGMVVSRGPQCRAHYTLILIVGIPRKVPVILGKHYMLS